jgi:lambda repressor-like predicted transcriptional regulator
MGARKDRKQLKAAPPDAYRAERTCVDIKQYPKDEHWWSYYDERAKLMARMRKAGYSYRAIGKAAGVTGDRAAHVLYAYARKKLQNARRETDWDRFDSEWRPSVLRVSEFRKSWAEWLPFIIKSTQPKLPME